MWIGRSRFPCQFRSLGHWYQIDTKTFRPRFQVGRHVQWIMHCQGHGRLAIKAGLQSRTVRKNTKDISCNVLRLLNNQHWPDIGVLELISKSQKQQQGLTSQFCSPAAASSGLSSGLNGWSQALSCLELLFLQLFSSASSQVKLFIANSVFLDTFKIYGT